METLLHDVRYALRLLRKSPGFAIAAVLTLALGMGANTVMFSVLSTVLLRPLPYPQPDRLVQIWETDSRRGEMHNTVSPYNYVDWQNQSQSFAQMATYDYNSVVLTGQKAPVRLGAHFVSAGFFDVLKVSPLKGRTFLPDEDQPGKVRAAVLSFGSWLNYFGGDPGIVGRSIVLDDQEYSVVGIMPSSFGFPSEGVQADAAASSGRWSIGCAHIGPALGCPPDSCSGQPGNPHRGRPETFLLLEQDVNDHGPGHERKRVNAVNQQPDDEGDQ